MPTYDFSNLTVLVVEDNHHMALIVRTLLKGFGVQKVHEVADAPAALEALATYAPDVIILDYMLKGLDGIELTSLIRNAEDSPNRFVPIIMVSAHSERRRVEAALNAGVHEFLKKPISAKDLYLRLLEVIEHPRPSVRNGAFFGPERRRRSGEPSRAAPEPSGAA